MTLRFLRLILVATTLANILLNVPISGKIAAASDRSVTRDLRLDLTVDAERYSDIQYYLESPNGDINELPTFINSSDRTHNQTVELGVDADEREGCIDLINKRRTGICEDGIYKVYVQSTDAVGNQSDYLVMEVERDTVRPIKPEGELYICGLNICLRIDDSEPNSFINNGFNDIGQVDINGRSSFVILRNFAEDTTYNFSFISKDRAWNESDKLELSIHTPSFGRGGGGEGILGSSDNVYAGLEAKDFNDAVEIQAYARPDGLLDINSIDIIPPLITYIQNIQTDGNIIVYGVGLTQGQQIAAKVSVEFKGYTLEESVISCGLTMTQYLLNPQNSCVNYKLYLVYSDLSNTNCSLPQFVNCKSYFDSPSQGFATYTSQTITLNQVEIDLFRDGDEYINPLREKYGFDIDLPNRVYRNEKANGRFQFAYNKTNLLPGQKLSASLKAYFDDIEIDYNGYKFKNEESNQFAVSPKGNEYVVPEESSFFEDVVHPLAYDAGCKKVDTVWSGPDGDDDYGSRPRFGDFHRGVDLRALNGGKACLVNTVKGGNIAFAGKDSNGGNIVDVSHTGNYMTRYIHGSDFLVEEGTDISKGTYVFTMGCTGKCTGRHLHFELFIESSRVDPQSEEYFGYMGGDGSFYNNTKIY